MHKTSSDAGQKRFYAVDLLRHYWNRADLLEQLGKVSEIVYQSSLAASVCAHETGRTEAATRSRWLRHRFTADEQQAMIDLYRSGAPAREVAEKYNVNLRSFKRLLQVNGVRRRSHESGS